MDKAEKIIAECESHADTFDAEQKALHPTQPSMRYPSLAGALKFHIKELCREINRINLNHQAPNPAGSLVCNYHDYEVHFDYTPAESGSWEEPGNDAEVEIVGVYAANIDVLEDLAGGILEAIEECCFESVKQSKFDQDYDLAEERYQDRMAA